MLCQANDQVTSAGESLLVRRHIDRKHSLHAPYHWHATKNREAAYLLLLLPATSLICLGHSCRSDQRLMCIFTMPLPYVGPANAAPNAVLYTMDSSSTNSGKLCARLVVLFISILHAMEESWTWTRTSRQALNSSQCPSSNSTCSKLVIGGNPRGDTSIPA